MNSNFLKYFLVLGAVLAVLIFIFLVIRIFRYKKASDAARRAEPGDNWEIRPRRETPPFNEKNLSEQSQEWILRMHEAGKKIADLGVRTIYFVHGTFVGDDPFDLLRLLSDSFPRLEAALKLPSMAGVFNKDNFFKDVGYFTSEYCELAEKHLGHGLRCRRFCWSSGNHHVARVTAAFELLEDLSTFPENREGKILLTGHSHAGQLFALLTRMLHDRKFAFDLLHLIQETGAPQNHQSIRARLKLLKKKYLYFVTLGTPPRYSWYEGRRHRILHIINHRLNEPVAGGFGGILTTRDGDYIQQIGIAGSDSLSPVKKHPGINKRLNRLLDEGCNPGHWQKVIRLRQRLHPQGYNYLADYGDNKKTPNFMATVFGHGIYTRYRVLLYNMEEISEYFQKHP